MATGPFYDTMPGPLRRDTLNEMWGVWQDAIGTLIKGDAGWSPLMRSVQDSDRVVLEVYDWVGGQGSKPIQTGFLGSAGFVATAALAVDIRGPQGLQGIQGVKGDTGLTGDKGDAATISVGTVTTSASGLPASVTNSGTPFAAVFDFSIPQGEKGDTGSSGTISVGTTTTVPEGSPASVTNTGTPSAAVLNFSIPKGDRGDKGTAATIAVGTVTTGTPGTSVVVTNSGTPEAAVFDFIIPRGADGAGAGDMLKATYDSVGDGVVNASRSTPWSGVTGKPAVIAAGADAASARLTIDAASSEDLSTGLGNKVDKVTGKGLSTEDFTTAEKTKLSGIAEEATVNQTDAFLLDRTNHTGSQAISTVTGLQDSLDSKQNTLISATNLKTINGESILGSGDLVVGGGGGAVKEWHFRTANTSYTVPAGMDVVRFYIGGRGGNGGGGVATGGAASGGGGGGFAFGDLTVSPGDVISSSFVSGTVTISLNGDVVATANPGGNGVTRAVNTTTAPGGAGGTASISGAVSNGGAYSGGAGGSCPVISSNTFYSGAGGGSCGSPLGNGFPGGGGTNVVNIGGGGGGIGGAGASASGSSGAVGGGGAGEPGGETYGGGSAVNSGRGLLTAFTDPLLKHAIGTRSSYFPDYSIRVSPSPGAGGLCGAGSDFGGGGGGNTTAITGYGGLMGGGGGVSAASGSGTAGNGGYGGGGGGARSLGVSTGGSGGAAFCFLYY